MADAIDAHTHFVPSQIPAEPARNPLWPSVEPRAENAAVMVGGRVFRMIDSRSWDAARRIDDMAAEDVGVQVLSPMPELLSHWFPAADADALCRLVNEGIAVLCAVHPERFIGVGMVPMQDTALAVRAVEECRALGLRGIEIGTHINGIALGDIRLHDIYAAIEQAGLMLMVHPLHPIGLDRIGGGPELAAVAAFPLETALAAVSLMTHGVPERFPKLRILLSHGGGALPWILPRLKHATELGPPLSRLLPADPAQIAKSFYYDTILYDPPALRFLVEKVGIDRLVVGSDYPFTIRQGRPAQFAERSLSLAREVFSANARRLFGLGEE